MEAEYDLYAAGSRRCLLSCNDSGQRRPFIFSLGGKQLFATDSSFLAMDGAAAGSGGPSKSPYRHGRHDAEKGKLGISNQFDLVGIAAPGGSAGSVPGRGILTDQPVTCFLADGDSLWDGRERNAALAARNASPSRQSMEMLQRRFAVASSAAGGAEPSSAPHCYAACT